MSKNFSQEDNIPLSFYTKDFTLSSNEAKRILCVRNAIISLTDVEEIIFSPMSDKTDCCKVESIINIDERGQMVLPKELREKANIHPGDKLVLICLEKKEKIYCFSLVKVEELTGMVKDLLGPMMKEMVEAPLSR